jgi:sugar O-acyltransferase (sialic acid O-acetyltransferase NeuD family)
MRNFIFWGGTGHCIGLAELLSYGDDKVVAIFDNNRNLRSPFEDVPLYHGKEAFEEWLSAHAGQEIHFAAAIAGWNNIPRLEYHEYMKSKGLKPATLIHPASFVARNASLGEACNIMTRAVICARVKLGRSVIVNSGSIIDHESKVEDGVHVSAGVNIGAECVIGKHSFIGIGATVMSYVTIGSNAFVGAGALVLGDVPDNAVVFGSPAKIYYYRDEKGGRVDISAPEKLIKKS